MRLDHAVVIVRDRMDAARDAFERLGFTLTPLGLHQLGSINTLMVFERDYLELLGFPPGREDARPEIAASPIGLDALVLDLHDVDGTHSMLTRGGFAPNPPMVLTRPVTLPDGAHEARFTTIRFGTQPVRGGRVYYCRHETPELVWRPEWMRHANGVHAIAAYTIVTPDPMADARRYASVTDASMRTLGPDEAIVALEDCELRLVTANALRARLGDAMPDPRDVRGIARESYMAMLTFRTRSIESASVALRSRGIDPLRLDADTLVVAARDAFNTTLAFSAS